MTVNQDVIGNLLPKRVIGLLNTGPDVTVFIDPVNGSDANSGRSPEAALGSFNGLLDRFPMHVMNGPTVLVKLAGVGGFDADATGVQDYEISSLFLGGGLNFQNAFQFQGPEMVPFTPATGPATAALDAGTPATTVDNTGAPDPTGNRTRFNFTTASPGWTVDDLAGKFLRVTRGGQLVYFEQPISKNTADTIFVDVAGIEGGALLDTDTVEIVEPGARFLGPAAFPNLTSMYVQGFGGNGLAGFFAAEPAMFTRIRWSGLLTTFGGIPRADFDRCCFDNVAQFVNMSVGMNNCCTDGQGILCTLTTMEAGAGSSGSAGGAPLDPGPQVQLVVTQAPFSSFNIFHSIVFFQKNVSVWDGGGDGFRADFSLVQTNPGVAIQGSGNGGVGIKARTGSAIQVNGGALTALTGGAGDLKVMEDPGLPAISYGTGAGEFEEAAGYAGNFTRMLEGAAAAPAADSSRIATFI